MFSRNNNVLTLYQASVLEIMFHIGHSMSFHLMAHALWSLIFFIFIPIVPLPLKRKNLKFEICILNSF